MALTWGTPSTQDSNAGQVPTVTFANPPATPSGSGTGDLLLVVIGVRAQSSNAHAAPAGWTKDQYTPNGSTIALTWYTKRAAAGEAGPYTFTLDNGTNRNYTASFHRAAGLDGTTIYDVATAGQTSSTSPVTTTAGTTGSADAEWVAGASQIQRLANFDDAGWGSPAGSGTELVDFGNDGTTTQRTNQGVGAQTVPTAGTNFSGVITETTAGAASIIRGFFKASAGGGATTKAPPPRRRAYRIISRRVMP